MDKVTLKVVARNMRTVDFEIQRNARMDKLMQAYCQYMQLSQDHLIFRFKKLPLHENDTANSMSMSNNDVIHVTQLNQN